MNYRFWVAFLFGLLTSIASVQAGDLKVISGGAIQEGLADAVKAFEVKTGHKVDIAFISTPQIKERIKAGEVFDVVVVPKGYAGKLVEGGLASEGIVVGRVGAGVAVRDGAPVPVIASVEDVKSAVLNAESVVFNRASSGQYIEELFVKMGIWEQIKGKTSRYDRSGQVMKHLLKGKGKEIGFGPVTAISRFKDKGLVLVGPLPKDIQKLRVYKAVSMKAGANKKVAEALIKFLGSDEAKKIFIANGTN